MKTGDRVRLILPQVSQFPVDARVTGLYRSHYSGQDMVGLEYVDNRLTHMHSMTVKDYFAVDDIQLVE